MTIGEIGERMSAHELMRWVGYFQLRHRKQEEAAEEQRHANLARSDRRFG